MTKAKAKTVNKKCECMSCTGVTTLQIDFTEFLGHQIAALAYYMNKDSIIAILNHLLNDKDYHYVLDQIHKMEK
jgi:hypothetical protein